MQSFSKHFSINFISDVSNVFLSYSAIDAVIIAERNLGLVVKMLHWFMLIFQLLYFFIIGCMDEFSAKFCLRFKRFCAHRNRNGEFMAEKCRYTCGCP